MKTWRLALSGLGVILGLFAAGCGGVSSSKPATPMVTAIVEIPHPEAEAVIGGFVYHGSALNGMQGIYIFGDLNGKIWSLKEDPANTFTRAQLADTGFNISSFGQDSAGELYVADIANGRVLKIVPR